MPAQKGRDLLLKLDPDNTNTFQTVAGLRATRINFNADTVDVTHRESAGRWRELFAGAGGALRRSLVPAFSKTPLQMKPHANFSSMAPSPDGKQSSPILAPSKVRSKLPR